MMRARLSGALAATVALLLTGCVSSFPADPRGTIDRVVDGGELRVGATANEPWVRLDGTEPSGSEAELVAGFAEQRDADVEWETGSEAVLVSALERGELDIVIGGFRDDTPWQEKAAVTRPYTEVSGPDGPEKLVMLTRMGENGLLVALEKYLDEEAP